jgi:hypothetical protein
MMPASSAMPVSDVMPFVVVSVLTFATVGMQVLAKFEPHHKNDRQQERDREYRRKRCRLEHGWLAFKRSRPAR